MDLWKWIGGIIRMKLTGADLSESLSRIINAGIALYEICWIDDLNCELTVKSKDTKLIRKVVESRGDNLQIKAVHGLPCVLRAAAARPLLLVGIAVLLFLDIYLPTRILFFKVEGNSLIPESKILEAADSAGLGFWSDRRGLRSEKVKNALLEAVPQLQWVGVNTKGCVAIISVRERQSIEQNTADHEVSSIVAARDGVISSVTATRGNPLCKVGQAIRAGEVLISGYTDCGITIQATRAEGEVYAYTKHHFRAVTPSVFKRKGEITGQSKKYTLRFGKKRINFSKSSGISTPNCDKMISQYYLELPGGFRLPVSLEVETLMMRTLSDVDVSEESALNTLSSDVKSRLLKKMVAGQILKSNEKIAADEGVYLLEGEYACLEMIGQVRKEEHYGKIDGTDR